MLLISLPLASKAAAMAAHGWNVVAGFTVISLAIAAPLALDLWAVVSADQTNICWRNSIVTRRLAWSEVAGFERGATSMVLRRKDGREYPLRVLGLRYFGSRKLAVQRVSILENLRALN